MTPLGRLHFLDHLRVLALGSLLLYHLGMVYVPWAWHVKAAASWPPLEPWMRALEPWRMSLLFVVSGAVTGLLLPKAGPGWVGARMRRLGWPLLAGVLVIVPPQVWWQVREQFQYTGSYLDFLSLYFRGSRQFCAEAGPCLVLPTWNHLWFLPYLMAYTLLLWAVLQRWPRALDRAGAWWSARLGVFWVLVVPWLVLAGLRLALRPWFQVTHDLLSDALGHAQYLPVFLAGAVLAHTPEAWAALARWRWPALQVAVAAWVALLALDDAVPPAVLRLAYALQQWCGVAAALGWGHRCLPSGTSPAWQALSQRVFPVYVLHQTVLIGAVVALRPLAWPPALEAAGLLALTVAGSCLLAEAGGRLRWLAPWLGWAPR